MASELRVNTLKDASGNNSVATSVVFNGTAKAWINPAANYGSIQASYNISSLDDDGTGEGGLHLTNDMSSANYAISAACEDGATTDSWAMVDITRDTQTAGSVDFESHWGNASYNRQMADYEVYLVIHGDLA